MRSLCVTSEKVRWVWETFLDILYPRTCVACGLYVCRAETVNLCQACFLGIDWIDSPTCPVCGAPVSGKLVASRPCPACLESPPAFDACRSLFMYRGIGARLLHALKYEGGTWLKPQLEHLLRGRESTAAILRGKAIVPVPLHWWKHYRRGYNQADIIAAAVKTVYPDCEIIRCLQRKRHTTSQTTLSRSQRLQNMKGVFECENLPDKHRGFVLVDDVLTTGATIDSAASAMRRAGVKQISAFTLAHG